MHSILVKVSLIKVFQAVYAIKHFEQKLPIPLPHPTTPANPQKNLGTSFSAGSCEVKFNYVKRNEFKIQQASGN